MFYTSISVAFKRDIGRKRIPTNDIAVRPFIQESHINGGKYKDKLLTVGDPNLSSAWIVNPCLCREGNMSWPGVIFLQGFFRAAYFLPMMDATKLYS